MMTKASIARIVVPCLALVAAGGVVLAFGITHLRRERPVEASAVTAAPAISPRASGIQDQDLIALATSLAETKIGAAALVVPPSSPGTGDGLMLTFDIARIEPSGDAVIAGRAAPGASVELLRDGELHDRVVADQSGQFVMVPPRLAPGDHVLTLRSRQPDGEQATSKQSVVVATLQPNLEVRSVVAVMRPDKANVVLSNLVAPTSIGSPVVEEMVEVAKQQDIAGSGEPHAAAVTAVSEGGSPSVVAVPKITSTVVSRGDSLWRISRASYGTGRRYAVIFGANREQIRNPNRIYPGQIFVLPERAR
jgi:nucleoid-associated protein YgaU